jgi:hypothetical protein
VGPRGAEGGEAAEGGPGFLPEAGWKPAALPGAWRQQLRGWAERGARGSRGGKAGTHFSRGSGSAESGASPTRRLS